jgi:serine/threonine-protein kinase
MNLVPGTRLGAYEIVASVGKGGFGEVYRARDTRLDRSVAIKVLPSSDPDLRARFEREAHTIAALQHPNICALHDVGHQDSLDYLVLEFLEGETLAERLRRGSLPLDEALKAGIAIASALDRAHRAGIVHRDLKPENVMLTRSGPKLLDFGLAKLRQPVAAVAGLSVAATAERPLVTAKGTIVGTLHYMSPEQIDGRDADPRSDIWAFGCVLYEMLTAQKAFDGSTPASLIAAIMNGAPPRVSSVRPLTPSTVDRIVTTCLAPNPDDGFTPRTTSDCNCGGLRVGHPTPSRSPTGHGFDGCCHGALRRSRFCSPVSWGFEAARVRRAGRRHHSRFRSTPSTERRFRSRQCS